ncbi:MAG: hypothetical protein R3A80_04835 [Bdellovibrionota bacterium]
MRHLTLFFLLASFGNTALAADSHTGSESMRASNDDRVNDYNRGIVEAIRNARNRGERDRVLMQTGNETIFNKAARPGEGVDFYGTGWKFLDNLKQVSKNQCIPNLTILSHGWGSSRTSGGKGLPIAENSQQGFPVTGFYLDEQTREEELMQSYNEIISGINAALNSPETRERFKEVNGRDPTQADLVHVRAKMLQRYDPRNESKRNSGKRQIQTDAELLASLRLESKENSITMSDFKKAVKSGPFNKADVKFCSQCMIQVYSCNLHEDFVNEWATTTGCQIVYGTGMTSGTSDKQGDITLHGDHSSKDTKDANGKTIKVENSNTRDGQFVRVTPIKGTDKVITEKLGKTYTLFK